MSSAAAFSADRAVARRWQPRVTPSRPEVDPTAAETAAVGLLTALGLDLDDENLADTPRRMAQALVEMTSGPDFDLTTFPHDGGYDELVLVQDIPLQSVCEHDILPFVGVAHVGCCPATGSSDCPSSPAWSSSTCATRRPRKG